MGSLLWALPKQETAIDKLHKAIILSITENPSEWEFDENFPSGRWHSRGYKRKNVTITQFHSHHCIMVTIEGSGTFQRQFSKLQRKQLVAAITTLKTYLALQIVLEEVR